jgi:prepilin-type N-terminal cleavage/methylation domain-containing protein
MTSVFISARWVRSPKVASSSGMTLVELLIVLAIVGVVGSLVAPSAINQLNRARAQQETLNFLRLIDGLAFRAYLESEASEVLLEGTRVTLVSKGRQTATIEYKRLYFSPAQRVRFSENGVTSPTHVSVFSGSRERLLLLSPSHLSEVKSE